MKIKLLIKLEIIALVLFSIPGVFIIRAWNIDTNPNVDKYLFYLSIDFSVLFFLIILITCKLMMIFKHKDEKDPNTLNPKDERGYYSSAFSYYKKGLIDKAIEQYNMAIEIEPECAKIYFSRGVAYFDIGEYAKATKDFIKSKALEKKEKKLKKED